MDRLTTDNPQTNFQTLMNYAYAKDGRVSLRHADGQDGKDLCEYIASRSPEMCGGVTPDLVMEGECMACDCPLGILNTVATQAAELRGRLKSLEDILGDNYDLSQLKELVEANKENRVVVLPAPFGSKVWYLHRGRSKYGKISIQIRESRMAWHNAEHYTNQLGKTVFLTREVAEKMLEEFNGKTDNS